MKDSKGTLRVGDSYHIKCSFQEVLGFNRGALDLCVCVCGIIIIIFSEEGLMTNKKLWYHPSLGRLFKLAGKMRCPFLEQS